MMLFLFNEGIINIEDCVKQAMTFGYCAYFKPEVDLYFNDLIKNDKIREKICEKSKYFSNSILQRFINKYTIFTDFVNQKSDISLKFTTFANEQIDPYIEIFIKYLMLFQRFEYYSNCDNYLYELFQSKIESFMKNENKIKSLNNNGQFTNSTYTYASSFFIMHMINIFDPETQSNAKYEELYKKLKHLQIHYFKNANAYSFVYGFVRNDEYKENEMLKEKIYDTITPMINSVFEMINNDTNVNMLLTSQKSIALQTMINLYFPSEEFKEKIILMFEAVIKIEFSYFFQEIVDYIQQKMHSFDENKDEFEQKRKIGENESHLCQLIRDDCITDFIIYTTQTNLNLSEATIVDSIFESNKYLIDRNPTLAEYAAFFGSVQIFKYLEINHVKFNESIWFYAVHGRNAEIIHLLEEHNLHLDDMFYTEVLSKAITCFHNEIADYVQEYKITSEKVSSIYSASIKSLNYDYFPKDLISLKSFECLCKYNYLHLINILIKTTKIKDTIEETSTLEFCIKRGYSNAIHFILSGCEQLKNQIFVKSCLKHFVIPSSVKIIGKSAFEGCTSLTKVFIPSSVTEICDFAFCSCNSLKKVSLPSSVIKIGKGIFYECKSLKYVDIQGPIIEIPEGAFGRCSSLDHLVIPSSVQSIGTKAFPYHTLVYQFTFNS